MTRDEALDALAARDAMAGRIARFWEYDEPDEFYREEAEDIAAFLRDHPDVARALGIGAEPCVGTPHNQCHIRHSLPEPS